MLRKEHAMKIEKLVVCGGGIVFSGGDDAGGQQDVDRATSDWSNAGNWSPAGVPGLDYAVFINSGSVLATEAVAVASVNLSGGTCTFNGPPIWGAHLERERDVGGHQRGDGDDLDVDGRVYDGGGADGGAVWWQFVD